MRSVDDDVPVTRRRIDRHTLYTWGWSRAAYANRSCGTSIAVGPRLRNCVKEVFVPPVSLTGRCSGLRIRTRTCDLAYFAVYLAPRGSAGEDHVCRVVRSVLS